MDLRKRLQRRTLATAIGVTLLLAAALAVWTIHDTRREVEATRALVRSTVQAVLAAQGLPPGQGLALGQGSPASPGSAAFEATEIRHVAIRAEHLPGQAAQGSPQGQGQGPERAQTAQPGGTPPESDLLDRWIDERIEHIALGPPGSPSLQVSTRARSELLENLSESAWILTAIVLFGVAVAAVQYRTLLAGFASVEVFVARIRDFESGERDARLPVPEIEELAPIAQAFNRMAQTLELSAKRQQELSQLLLTLRDEERRRIARELHDDIGQSLTALSVKLALLRRNRSGTEPGTSLDQLEQDVEHLRNATRALLSELRADDDQTRPAFLEPDGLIRHWQSRRPDIDWQIEPGISMVLGQLRMPQWHAACRILQEALTNAVRHANPRQVRVSLQCAPSSPVPPDRSPGSQSIETIESAETPAPAPAVRALTIVNDGCNLTDGSPQPPGNGLRGMQERAREIGASLQVGPTGSQQWQVRLVFAQSA